MTLCDTGPSGKMCFRYCGDGICDCYRRPIGATLSAQHGRQIVHLPKPMLDQVEYLKRMQHALQYHRVWSPPIVRERP